MPSESTIATGLSTLVLALTFLVGGRVRPMRRMVRDEGRLLGLSAGVSIAYVFVHMMPEIAAARETYASSAKIPVIFRGILVYIVAMVGFMVYYGLDSVRMGLPKRADGQESRLSFGIHIGGFALYVWMITDLLVNRLEKTSLSVALYTVAMVAHFLTIDNSLFAQHKVPYERTGRWLLAAMCVVGWASGMLIPLPLYVLALMVAFVSGAIIMNSAIMELPHREEQRFLSFIAGGLLYAALLAPLG